MSEESVRFVKCAGAAVGCIHQVEADVGLVFCPKCLGKLPVSLQETLAAAAGDEDCTGMAVTACLAELQQQRVEQVPTKRRRC